MAPRQDLSSVLPEATQHAWSVLRGSLPDGAYLVGGTGIAVQLFHRTSRDLDFFVARSFDPGALAQMLPELPGVGQFVVTMIDEGTLNGVLDEAKVQFLETTDQRIVEPLVDVAGIPVAGLGDLLATKLNVVGGRGELRDYFDLLVLERDAERTVEEGCALFVERYQPVAPGPALAHIIEGLGYFEDVADDPSLPMGRADIERYWKRRQPEVRHAMGLDRF